ncbi:MAG: efflux RND transporter periplasmic adaptor subunit, partial [Alphaproteobacteria bacterium]|nr:efflux RND transporter periplasmic adaptor subunit [Alphaproteobacteria bacterium]
MPRRARLVAATLVLTVVATLIPPPAAGQRPTPVETAPVETRAMADTLTVAGRLEANRRIMLTPEVNGHVAEIRFEEGERVEAGTVLVVLDAALEQARLARADADLAADRRALERARTLAERGAGTEAAVDEAQAAYDRTRAEVQVRQTLLQKTRITAPFSGRTGFRQVDLGAYVGPGDPLVSLVDADPIEVAFDLPGRVAGTLGVGDTVTVRPDSFAPEADGLSATVTAIDPAVDPAALALGVRAELANPDGALRPGMFVRVEAVLDRVADAR